MIANENSNRVEILTAITMKCSIFWDVTPCSPVKIYRRFGGAYCLHLQVRKTSQAMRSACLFTRFGLLFDLKMNTVHSCETSVNIYQTILRHKLEDVQPWLLMLVPAQNTRTFSSITRGLISLWLYKENNKLRDRKNVFTLHIPSELHTLMTSLF
jgi:hypothetical protein